jgi:ParB family chromosome partitioning protein
MDDSELQELADSIKLHGLINPIHVKPHGPRYEIIAGHRRYMAHERNGAITIRAEVIAADSGTNTNAIQFAENFQRSDLSPIEEARALCLEHEQSGKSIQQIASMVRRSPEWVEARMALMDLPDDLGPLVHTRRLAIASAQALAKCHDDTHRRYLTDYCINSGASAGTIGAWVQQWHTEQLQSPGVAPTLPHQPLDGERPTIQLPCWSCRTPYDYSKMAIVRMCPACHGELAKEAA